jgi:hypothetical protein
MSPFFANDLLPSSVTVYLQHMSLSFCTSPEAAAAACTSLWSVALLVPATGSPQEAASGPAHPLLMFYQSCLLLSVAVLEHSELSIFLLEHSVSSIIC